MYKIMTTPVIKIDKIQYLVIGCGYTDRLIKHIKKIQADINEITANNQCCCNVKCSDLKSCKTLTTNDILFLESYIPRSITNNPLKVEKINYVRETLAKNNVSNYGIVCVECEELILAYRIAQSFMDVEHCGCFDFGNLYNMQLVENSILVMTFDTESG